MEDFKHLNPDDFRRWMLKKESVEDPDAWMIGLRADPRFCGKKTAQSISLETGSAGRVLREFVQEGGIVKSIQGEGVLVEVRSGSFYIPKNKIIV